MIEKSIILFKCRKKLNSKLKERVIDPLQKVYIVHRINELKKLISVKKYPIVIYDKKEKNSFIEIIKKLLNEKKFFSVIIMSNNEAKKFNFKKHQFENIIYISNPSRLEELSQFLELLFKIALLRENVYEYDKIIQAFESTNELSRKELLDAYESLKARECVSELSRKELMETRESLRAWERVAELSRIEKIERIREFEALKQVLEFSRQERILAEKIINAWEKVMELGREELLNAYSKLQELIKEKNELIKKLMDKFSQTSSTTKEHSSKDYIT